MIALTRMTKKKLRQFQCVPCGDRTWFERATRSQCRECDGDGTLIPEGEETGVLACKFMCDCGNEYTVICEMTDTAKCYGCKRQDNSPYGFGPRNYINKKTDNKHSCSKCNGRGNCPNLSSRSRFR